MKIYFIYTKVPTIIYERRIKYLVPSHIDTILDDNSIYFLYAWTKNKDILMDFIDTREKDIYDVKKKDIDETEYSEIKKIYHDYKLEVYKYYYDIFDNPSSSVYRGNRLPKEKLYKDKSYIEIVTPKFEHTNSSEYLEENFSSFGPELITEESPDYIIFKEPIIEALDMLSYTFLFDTLSVVSDENMDRADFANYNAGFNLSPLGNKLNFYKYNEYQMLIYLYHYMFLGR